MTFLTLIDGVPETALTVSDRALAYGDGLFETLRVIQGTSELFDWHWQRLTSSAESLGIPLPLSRNMLLQAVNQVVSGGNGVAKLIVSRGSGGRGYRSPEHPKSRWILQGMPLPDADPLHYQNGVSVRSCRLLLSEQPALAGLKHLNRLEQVMARREWQDEVFEGLLFTQTGVLIEATMANIFLFRNGVLQTPALNLAGVKGVMRDAVLAYIRHQKAWRCEVTDLTAEDLCQADGVFICNGVRGIVPVTSWRGDDGTVAERWRSNRHPGIRQLMAEFHPRLHLPFAES